LLPQPCHGQLGTLLLHGRALSAAAPAAHATGKTRH
jgi:hypothetical protein